MTGGRRIVVHLSDLHFGREDPVIVAALIDEIHRLVPDFVIVSGDFTQRAGRHQFLAVREFLDALPFPTLVIPGNHDVPLYNLFARIFNPLGGYRKFITHDLEPAYVDESLAVVGLDTTMPWRLTNGRVDESDLVRVSEVLRGAPESAVKIVVGHHPFDAPDE